MDELDQKAGEWKKVAVIDGHGSTAEVHLLLEEVGGDRSIELPWPDGWPSWVSSKFLKSQGYEVVRA